MTDQAAVVVRVSRRLDASPERVFDAWLDPTTVGKFLFATPHGETVQVEIGARVGGRFLIVEQCDGERASHYGRYLQIERPRRIAFRLSTEPDASGDRVVVEITPAAEGSDVTIFHVLAPGRESTKKRTATVWKDTLRRLEKALA